MERMIRISPCDLFGSLGLSKQALREKIPGFGESMTKIPFICKLFMTIQKDQTFKK